MVKLEWTNDDAKRYNLVNDNIITNLINFAEKHDYDITSLISTEQLMYKNLDTIKQILHKMNYSIEVTETSSAGIVSGLPADDVWVRNHKYRWLVIEWDNEGKLQHTYYNYNNETKKEEFFKTYYDAIYSAICYILENC